MYYVIMRGDYSDRHIVAVTCDKQKANKIKQCYSDDYGEARIEQWEESALNFDGYYRIEYNTLDNNYEIEKQLPEDVYDDVNSICEYYHKDGFRVVVQAENKEIALKIARDLFAEYKAKKEEII